MRHLFDVCKAWTHNLLFSNDFFGEDMESMRFNKLVDSVRKIRLAKKLNELDSWEPNDLLQREMDINAIIEKFYMARSGQLKSCQAYKTLPFGSSLHHEG